MMLVMVLVIADSMFMDVLPLPFGESRALCPLAQPQSGRKGKPRGEDSLVVGELVAAVSCLEQAKHMLSSARPRPARDLERPHPVGAAGPAAQHDHPVRDRVDAFAPIEVQPAGDSLEAAPGPGR